MGAAVLEGVDLALGIARHHDRTCRRDSTSERVRLRQFRLEAQEAPGVAAENALHLLA